MNRYQEFEACLKDFRLTTTPGNAMPTIEEIDGRKYAIGFDPASPGSDVSGLVIWDSQTKTYDWSEIRICGSSIMWKWLEHRPRCYISARKKKTRRERRWRRRNRR